MAALPSLPSLQAFEAVARRRSFALAAAELHLTASAISHQIARLESHLGVRIGESLFSLTICLFKLSSLLGKRIDARQLGISVYKKSPRVSSEG